MHQKQTPDKFGQNTPIFYSKHLLAGISFLILFLFSGVSGAWWIPRPVIEPIIRLEPIIRHEPIPHYFIAPELDHLNNPIKSTNPNQQHLVSPTISPTTLDKHQTINFDYNTCC